MADMLVTRPNRVAKQHAVAFFDSQQLLGGASVAVNAGTSFVSAPLQIAGLIVATLFATYTQAAGGSVNIIMRTLNPKTLVAPAGQQDFTIAQAVGTGAAHDQKAVLQLSVTGTPQWALAYALVFSAITQNATIANARMLWTSWNSNFV